MPQRFLRPGITTSDGWNSCGWKAQSLYVRLITLVDDYGRYDGRIPIIHGHCFALRPDIKAQETAALVCELSDRSLLMVYSVEQKPYIQLLKWQERTRGESRYPDPKNGEILRNPAESCGILPPEPAPLAISHQPSPLHQPKVDGFDEFWKSYPRKVGKGAALRKWRKIRPSKEMIQKILQAVTDQKACDQWTKDQGNFIPHPTTWLNAGRWDDEAVVIQPRGEKISQQSTW